MTVTTTERQAPWVAEARTVKATLTSAVSSAFVELSALRYRQAHEVGISMLGQCRRMVAYALAGVPPTDDNGPGEDRPANLGTLEHEGFLPVLARQLPGSTVERKVILKAAGLELPGHIDLDEPQTVVDLKTVGEWRLSGVRRTSAAYYHHRVQVGGYALARLQEGTPPTWVAWVYMDRASGDVELIVEPFTNGLALLVIDRVTELARWAEQPAIAPRDERGPGLSVVCDGCRWLRECWGEDAVPGQIGAQWVRSDPEVEAALADYVDARDRKKRAEDDMKYATARLERARFGDYGSYTYFRRVSTVVDDAQTALELWKQAVELINQGDERAALALLRDNGVPHKTKRGAIVVKMTSGVPSDRT